MLFLNTSKEAVEANQSLCGVTKRPAQSCVLNYSLFVSFPYMQMNVIKKIMEMGRYYTITTWMCCVVHAKTHTHTRHMHKNA